MNIKRFANITNTTIVDHRYCDDCGVKIVANTMYDTLYCYICGKDLCNKCVEMEIHNEIAYRDVYCKKCWDIGKKYRLKIKKLENEIKKLSEEWTKRFSCKQYLTCRWLDGLLTME